MFEKLIKLVREGKVSLFIGTGFSIEANAPTESKLKKLILNEFDNENLKEEHENDELAELAECFVEEVCAGSRNELIGIMKKVFEFEPECMDDHKLLATIPHFKTLFTTNYDTLLEDSYAECDRRVIRNDEACTYDENKRVSIYKLHGDFVSPSSVVITTSDYKKYRGANKRPNPIMWNDVISEFTRKNILFIGYSLKDNNVIEIIRHIKRHVGKNIKQMFLISPEINNRQVQLKKMGVTYIKAFAKDFLSELYKSLSENITDDFRHKKIDAETFTIFCQNHRYTPQMSLSADAKHDNKIEGIKALPGEKLEQKITMTISTASKAKLEDVDFEKNGEYLTDTPLYRGVPCIRFSGDELLKCSYEINGITQCREFASVIIGPAENKLDLTIRIPSRDFFEKVQAKGYRLNNRKLLIFADCHIYDLSIIVYMEGEIMKVSVTFNFRKKFGNIDLALKWIDVPLAFFSNEGVILDGLFSQPLKYGDQDAIPSHNFDNFKQYYSDVREIEMLTGKKFSVYNECTKENFETARIIRSYLKHEYISKECDNPNGTTFSAITEEKNVFFKKVHVNDSISIVTTNNEAHTIILNEQPFTLPYRHDVYNSCIVKTIKPYIVGKVKVDFFYPESLYYVLFSNHPVNEEFPNMEFIDDFSAPHKS